MRGTVHNNRLCQAGVQCPHNFRFLYLHCVVGQGATGRSWHSASLHCQALLFRQLRKPNVSRKHKEDSSVFGLCPHRSKQKIIGLFKSGGIRGL